jgi:hypothetical protein
MPKIEIGPVGKIVEGDDAGYYVKIVDDEQNTGGFLVITSDSPDFSTGYDDWVENRSALEEYFVESGWRIEWSDES